MSKLSGHFNVYIAILTFLICGGVFMYFMNNRTKIVSNVSPYKEVQHEVKLTPTVTVDKSFTSLEKYLTTTKGEYSVVIKNLDTGKEFKYNENKTYYAASLYKFPLAVAAMKEVENGSINLDQKYTYKKEDYADGTGVLAEYKYGSTFTLEQILTTLLKQSDNISQNILIRTLPQRSVINAFSIIPEEDFYVNNNATAQEISNYFETFYKGNYLTEDDKAYLLDLMSKTSFDDRISDNLSPGVVFSHKIGSWPGNYHDCGLAFSKVATHTICLMSGNAEYDEFLGVSKKVAEFYNNLISL